MLKPVMGSPAGRVGPGRAQPGVEFLALLQRHNDVLLGPATDLVPPAPAVRPEALTEDAAPAARAVPAVLAVGARRVLVIEDDAAPVLEGPSPIWGMHRWFPL